MVRKRAKFPEIGEMVVAQVENIEKMYIYVRLEDYKGLYEEQDTSIMDKRARGMVHISELANRWIRNVSNFARVNQRLVLKVLRVDQDRGHIDLSLRRVNNEQKTNKMNEWKYEVKAENLFKIFGENKKIALEEVYENFGFPLVDEYGDIHNAFDAVKENGKEALDVIEAEKELVEDFFKLIDSSVQLHQVEIEGQFEIVVYEGNGVELIKEAIEAAKKIKRDKFSHFEFHYIGAPYYRLKITANEYPDAEKYLKKIVSTIEKKLSKYNGNIEFERTD